MSECKTCHWWFKPDPKKKMGHCVLHTGLKGSGKAVLRFGGILRTPETFGCNKWEQDKRVKQAGNET